MFARFDENPAMTLRVIKETKRDGRTDGRTDARTHGQHENSIPPTNKVCGGYKTDARTHGQHENSIPPTNKVCGGYKKQPFFSSYAGTLMGLVARKPVFGVSNKASFKPVSSATETS